MDNILLGSLIAKILFAFRRAYATSFVKRLVDWFGNVYKHSAAHRFLRACLSRPSTLVYSRFYRMLDRFDGWIFHLNKSLRPAVENSLVIRAVRALQGASWWQDGVVVSSLRALGMRGVLLAAFALYLPIDWFLRSALELTAIASIWDEAFLLFSVLYLLFRMLVTRRERIKPRATPIDAPILFFLAAAFLVMMMVSPKMSIAVSGYRAVCQFMLWFFVLTRLIEDDRYLRVFYNTFCVMCVCIALHGIYQYIIGVEIPAGWVSQSEMGVRTRVFSIIGSPNIMGSLMVFAAPMLAALTYDKTRPLWGKLLLWGAVVVVCVAALFTFSRGAWFGLAIAVLLFCLIMDRKLVLLAVFAGVAVLLFVPEISNRITYLFTADFQEATNAGGRAIRWATGFSLLNTNPVFGFGLGRFGGAIAMQNQVVDGLKYFYMDNYYMKTLVEMGYAGLSAYLILLLATVVSCIRGMHKTHRDAHNALAVGMFCGMIGVLAHCYFENIFEVPYMNAYFWGFAAAIMFLSHRRKMRVGN